MCKEVQVLDTKFAIIRLVLPSYVLVQLPECLEIFTTYWALVGQHGKVLVLNFLRLEAYLELSVHGVDVVLYKLKLGL